MLFFWSVQCSEHIGFHLNDVMSDDFLIPLVDLEVFCDSSVSRLGSRLARIEVTGICIMAEFNMGHGTWHGYGHVYGALGSGL